MFNLRSLMATLLLASASSAHALPVDLGIAGQFNAFVFNNFETTGHTDAKGSVAAGGNANINYGWSVASDAATFSSAGQSYGMVVGGDLNWTTSGQVFNGKTYVGGTATVGAPAVNVNPGGTGGLVSGSSPVDFAAAQSYLTGLSGSLKTQSATGVVTYNYGGIQLNGTGAANEVFYIDGSKLGPASYFSLSGIDSAANLIVNVSGANLTLDYMETSTLFKSGQTLFNFYDALGLHIEGTSPHFNILAPKAQVTGQWGHIEGTVVASSWKAQTELHIGSSTSSSSSSSSSSGGQVPEPQALLLVLAALGLLARSRNRV